MRARLVILMMAASLTGCLSDQPIAPGSAEPLDRSLLGTWRCVFPEEADPALLKITEGEGRAIRAVISGGGDEQPSTWTAYLVSFEGKHLLNVQADDKEKWWTVAQYTLYRPTILHVEYPKYDNETLKGVATPAQRRDALRRGYKAKTLFDESFTCVRVMKEGSQK